MQTRHHQWVKAGQVGDVKRDFYRARCFVSLGVCNYYQLALERGELKVLLGMLQPESGSRVSSRRSEARWWLGVGSNVVPSGGGGRGALKVAERAGGWGSKSECVCDLWCSWEPVAGASQRARWRLGVGSIDLV